MRFLNPESKKTILERVQAKYRTSEKRAEHETIRKKIRIEFPPDPTPNRGNSAE
jgi:hypothetical protein